MRRSSFLLFLFLFSNLGYAQQFGGFKPSKMWLSLEEDNYRILFTSDNQERAQEVAAIFRQMNGLKPNIGLKRRNITTIFQESTTQANGYVGLAPFVSEYFLTPLPNSNLIGSLPWHGILGIHEYQHVLQFSNSRNGISKWSYILGGQAGWSAALAFSIPNWFFEGDAVRAETQYSNQGRGRIPHFFNAYRAYAAQDNTPHYFKLRSGSIRDFMPDHYRLGYLMISYGREKYGDQFWAKVLKESTAYKGILYPFSRALKRNSGMNSRQFFDSSMYAFSQDWKLLPKDEINSNNKALPKNTNRSVNHYYFPQFADDSTLVFVHESFDKAAHFYTLTNGELSQHRALGIRSENYFDAYAKQIAFTQTYFNSRWGWTDYSDVLIYNFKKKKTNRLTYKQKYFHPCFSPNGKQLAVLEVASNGQYSIHLLNTKSGQAVTKLPNPNNYYFTYIQWLDSNNLIAASRDSLGRMAITKSNTADGKTQNLSPWTYHLIGKPMLQKGKVYFSASYSGVDNLYELNLSDGKIYELSRGGLGKYQPYLHSKNDSIYYTAFSLNGYQLKSASLKDLKRNELQAITPLKEISHYKKRFLSGTDPIAFKSDSVAIKPFRRFKSLLNFHSWTPSISSPNYSLSLNSDDLLNTLDLSVGYEYNSNENSGGLEAKIEYGQYFIHLNGELSRGRRSINYRSNKLYNEWLETEVEAGFSLPLQLSKNQHLRGLNLFANYNYLHINFNEEQFTTLEVQGSHLGLSYRQARLKAQKNIFTHFGVFASLSQKNSFDANQVSQSLIQTSLALPGIFKNHNLLIDFDAQFREGIVTYQYRDNFLYSRGFERPIYEELYKASFNYYLPLFYPDKGVAGIAFLQRIRSNLFFDYSLRKERSREFNSLGAELIFDLKWLHQYSFPIGVRYLHLLSSKSFGTSQNEYSWELFIPFARF